MAGEKPRGRLARNYRLTWVDDSGSTASVINPPVSPARLAHLTVGGLAGTPVDAFVATVGQCAGYTLSYPTKVEGMEFLVDRLNAGAALGGGVQWRSAENLRRLWADGHDPVRIVMDEAHRLGMDFWLQLRMNDWHHVDSEGKVYRLIGSDYYESHPELLVGAEGVAGWPESLQESLAWFQDFAHEKVRRIRLDTATEAIERYDAEGWEYDFMRCPGLFKYGTERANAHLITELIRDTRRMLDEVGRARGKTLGLSVRVPNTIAGATMLGLDVQEWIADHLVDIVVPSTFFAQDTEEDMREWVKLAAGTPVLIHPTIEEGFITGRRTGYGIPYFQVKSDPMQAMTVEMIRGLAARHHAAGVDGLYLFNYQGTWTTYGYDNSPGARRHGLAAAVALQGQALRGDAPQRLVPELLPAGAADPGRAGAGTDRDRHRGGGRFRRRRRSAALGPPEAAAGRAVPRGPAGGTPERRRAAAGRQPDGRRPGGALRACMGGVRPHAGSASPRRQPDQRVRGARPAPGEGAAAGAQRRGDRRLLPLPERPLDPAPRLQAADVGREVNQQSRQWMAQPAAGRSTPPKPKPHHFGFRPGVDLDKLNQLADELEAEAFVARYRRPVGGLASYSRTERSVSAT